MMLSPQPSTSKGIEEIISTTSPSQPNLTKPLQFSNWPKSLLSWREEKVESATTTDYTQPPPRPLTSFDNDAPPPVYQKETVQKRQRGKQEEPWKISAFMIIGSLLLSVTYLMNLIDWLSQAVSCYGSNLSIILTMIGISFGFHFAEAIVLSVSTFYTHRIANQSKNIFSNIILVISTISFLYSLFSSIILLLVMYLMMDEACLFTGKDRLFLESWLLSIVSFIFHLSFMIRSIFVRVSKSTKSQEEIPTRVFTVENPPSYFEQMPAPPKYTP